MKRSLVLAGLALALLAVCTVTVGCDNWEQNVYKTLAATQSAVNNAQAAYEVSSSQPGGVCPVVTTPCIPHTTTAFTVINKAKAAQTLAVDAMIAFERLKMANGAPDALARAQADVAAALNVLPGLIADIKALYAQGGGK